LTAVALAGLLVLSLAASAFSEGTGDGRKALLMERVTKYYDNRVKDKMADNFDLYDPFFKATVARKAYEASLLEVKFLSYKLGDVTITENIAKVPVDVMFEIPETVIMGKKIVVPPRPDSWVDDWVWLDNNWFKVYKMNMNRSYIPFFPSFAP
jgi:hypothetical protein